MNGEKLGPRRELEESGRYSEGPSWETNRNNRWTLRPEGTVGRNRLFRLNVNTAALLPAPLQKPYARAVESADTDEFKMRSLLREQFENNGSIVLVSSQNALGQQNIAASCR